MERLAFFSCALIDGLETAEKRAMNCGVPFEKIEHWKNTLRTALSPA